MIQVSKLTQKPKTIIFFSLMILFLVSKCINKNEMLDRDPPEEEYHAERTLTMEERDAFQKIKRQRREREGDNAGYFSSELKDRSENVAKTEREIKKFKAVVEDIRKDCQSIVDDYVKMDADLTHSSHQDEETSRIRGKYDVCSMILARMEAKGIY